MRNVRLVLGSGGARGMAHIGVIEELEKEGFSIKEVVGCSMGAVVGGIYCAGYLQEYKHWLIGLSRLDVFRLLDFAFSSQGFVKGERVFKEIEKLIGDHTIENFQIPFTAVAADMMKKREVHYTSGSLFKALRASIAIPTVFTPVMEGRSQLVDGGVLNPLPLNVIHPEEGDVVVAVNLNANTPVEANSPVVEEGKEMAAYQKMLIALLPQFLSSENRVEQFGFFDLLNKSFDMTQDRLTELTIDVHKPDIVVDISRDACGVFEFYRANEIIEQGRKAFQKAYTKI
ncbi:MAG TPA: patatin-like phospholipase family protein [Chryseolinea sp.]|nr:patatin-like phospholipase family protein [Flavobacteriales bacterium]HPH46313.1 patatin-like phospholipase family protein [Chryseolinea sp.]HPM32778.1 patatin-like phospholipase family protein [Chryseolinea sp.]